MSEGAVEDLRAAIAAPRSDVVAVVGSGVSIMATAGAESASWKGLLRQGIQRCVAWGATPEWARRRNEDLASDDLDELLGVAEQVEAKLGAPGGEYRRWLEETAGALRPKCEDVLIALTDLGVPLATTNYDGLLEAVTNLPAVTWREHANVQGMLRGAEPGVLHLHGYWKDPESVVLGIRSYDRVGTDGTAQHLLRVLFTTRTLLFVGFGEGLFDPNFGSLLRWARQVLAESPYRHYRLALAAELPALQKVHPLEGRILVLPYGDSFGDLPPFLRSLRQPDGGGGPSDGSRVRLAIDLRVNLGPIKRHLAGIVAFLRSVSGDETLRLLRLEGEQVSLHVLTSRAGYERIRLLFEAEELTRILDFPITWVWEEDRPAALAAEMGMMSGSRHPAIRRLLAWLEDQDQRVRVAAQQVLDGLRVFSPVPVRSVFEFADTRKGWEVVAEFGSDDPARAGATILYGQSGELRLILRAPPDAPEGSQWVVRLPGAAAGGDAMQWRYDPTSFTVPLLRTGNRTTSIRLGYMVAPGDGDVPAAVRHAGAQLDAWVETARAERGTE